MVMNAVRKRKMLLLLLVSSILVLVTGLVLYALRQNISLFYTPTQIVNGEASAKHMIRLGGMVVKGSIMRATKSLAVEFKLTDFKQTVTVHYQGILPDLFREGQGIVALGELDVDGQFKAQEVLAKHDANYMPPEVKDTLDLRGKSTEGANCFVNWCLNLPVAAACTLRLCGPAVSPHASPFSASFRGGLLVKAVQQGDKKNA
jgi:cytochrome c-type biogenesis protein CcmE